MNTILRARRLVWMLGGVVALILLVLILTARPLEDKTPKIQPDWSRGLRVGSTPWSQPPAIAVSDDGKRVHLAWPDSGPRGVGVHYLQLNERAQRVTEQWLEKLDGTPQSVRVLLDEQTRPHVFVMARLPGEKVSRVIHWPLQADGTQLAAPQPVSPPDLDVESFAPLYRQAGVLEVFFAADPESDSRGLYYARWQVEGHLGAERRLNERPAEQVAAQVDRTGSAHVIWAEPISSKARQVFYAVFPPGDPGLTQGTLAVEEANASSRIGVDATRAYIVWGESIKGNAYAGAGMGFTHYVTFPLGNPEQSTFASLNVPEVGEVDYAPYRGEYNVTRMASTTPPPGVRPTSLFFAPEPITGQHDEMVVAAIAGLAFGGLRDWLGRPVLPLVPDVPPYTPQHRLYRLLEYGLDERVLPVLLVVRDGRAIGYQVIAYTDGINAHPVVAADKSGNLYAAWLTGSTWAGFRLYYAAATAAARTQLDPTDLTDLGVAVVTMTWRTAAGLSLLPLLPLLVLPALIIAVGYTIFGSGSGSLYTRQSYGALIGACLAYWLTKEIVLAPLIGEPIIGSELAGWDRATVVWMIQLAIAGIASWITWRQIASKRADSVFWATLIFAGSDMLLTMLVAGPSLAVRQ